ncbi:MAG: asparagine synthetase A [Candidatus Aenigmarchaeota archaeon]|nr:asparagine synthetase A [Candidatus Aenigmarchaeota archaeon]
MISEKRYLTIKDPKTVAVLKIQDEILSALREFLRKEGFIEILAPIIGPSTDPGIRGAKQVSIDYYGSKFKVMSSMILYEQMVVSSMRKIFAVSPCVRIEPVETIKTGRHLVEFRQVDIEEAETSYEDSMRLAERMLQYVIKRIKRKCGEELKLLRRKLRVPKIPFKRLYYSEALRIIDSLGFDVEYGEEIPWDAEEALSKKFKDPFFITNYPKEARGFYYLEDSRRHGILKDFDLIFPEGFGEAISGGEREYSFEAVKKRMEPLEDDISRYEWYLKMLKSGILPSSGFGIGVERLTRFICGLGTVWEAVPFPKVPGVISP